MGLEPLSLAPDIADLRNWITEKGIHNLVAICTWDLAGNWSN